jgi:coatomer subunit beta'
MHLRVFNYNTHEKVNAWEGHTDYIRSLAVHPSQPYVLSSADDMLIKLWDWEKNWKCVMTFEGHTHYVMSVVFNPKDANTFASASLDKSVKVWNLGSSHPNYTLEGHEKGVNWVDYYHGGEKPYLVTAADDKFVPELSFLSLSCPFILDWSRFGIIKIRRVCKRWKVIRKMCAWLAFIRSCP